MTTTSLTGRRGTGYVYEAKRYKQGNYNDGKSGQIQGDYIQGGYVLALLAIVGIASYLLNLAALHFLRTDVNPVVEPVSNYAVGAYGFLSTAANIGGGLAALALTLGLYLSIAPPSRSRVGLFLLGLVGVSELLAAIFPIDVGAQATTIGT